MICANRTPKPTVVNNEDKIILPQFHTTKQAINMYLRNSDDKLMKRGRKTY